MPRLLVHVEGQTEETFVKEVLSEHLTRFGYSSVSARLVGNPRLRSRRGGIRSWETVRKEIQRHLKEDHGAIATIMVDYYALPQDWPGRAEAPGKSSTREKAEFVEASLFDDFANAKEMGPRFDARRFVPLVIMHEFEALLFSAPDRFALGICRRDLAEELRAIRQAFESPEDIDDSPETAPSKRIEQLYPGYEKPLLGPLAAMEIGLSTIRQECHHFNNRMVHLESLPELLSYLQ
jgi:hypothetical protein